MTKALTTILLALILNTSLMRAQAGPERGGHELELWTGGGGGVNGRTSGTGVWNVGARYGWILTDPHGPGPLRGRFEYAMDVVPIFWVFQPTGTAYGFGFNPVALKWNFQAHQRVAPYFEASAGTLITNHQVPLGTSSVNFMTGGAIGLQFLRSKYNWGAEVRYMHISNAGLATPNPGINTIQIRFSVGLFTQRK